MPDGQTIRRVLLEVVEELSRTQGNSLQSASILQAAAQRLNIRGGTRDISSEQALLTLFHDLFRTGHLAWGLNLSNPAPPFCHVTEQGRNTLRHLSRDPANPDGYLEHLRVRASLNPIASSYVDEALATYNAGCFKAAAVMIGAASESVIIELRDELKSKIVSLGRTPPKDLLDWRIKRVLDQLKTQFDAKRGSLPRDLGEMFDAYWAAFTQQIRTARNDAGHPNSIAPVTHETVHASLLIFPELAKLAAELRGWISTSYT
jgi:hypothetical protein